MNLVKLKKDNTLVSLTYLLNLVSKSSVFTVDLPFFDLRGKGLPSVFHRFGYDYHSTVVGVVVKHKTLKRVKRFTNTLYTHHL